MEDHDNNSTGDVVMDDTSSGAASNSSDSNDICSSAMSVQDADGAVKIEQFYLQVWPSLEAAGWTKVSGTEGPLVSNETLRIYSLQESPINSFFGICIG